MITERIKYIRELLRTTENGSLLTRRNQIEEELRELETELEDYEKGIQRMAAREAEMMKR